MHDEHTLRIMYCLDSRGWWIFCWDYVDVSMGLLVDGAEKVCMWKGMYQDPVQYVSVSPSLVTIASSMTLISHRGNDPIPICDESAVYNALSEVHLQWCVQ